MFRRRNMLRRMRRNMFRRVPVNGYAPFVLAPKAPKAPKPKMPIYAGAPMRRAGI